MVWQTGLMDFNPDTWGTVADWVGGLGTTAAFLATALVIYRDAKVRRLAQARKVVYTSERTDTYSLATYALHNEEDGPTPSIRRYTLKNLSDEPIYMAYFYYQSRMKRPTFLAKQNIVLPGADFVYESDEVFVPLAFFRDNSGVGWIRTIGGAIYPAGGIHRMNQRELEDELFAQYMRRESIR